MDKAITIYLTNDQYSLIYKKQMSLSSEDEGKKSISSIVRAILMKTIRDEQDASI